MQSRAYCREHTKKCFYMLYHTVLCKNMLIIRRHCYQLQRVIHNVIALLIQLCVGAV